MDAKAEILSRVAAAGVKPSLAVRPVVPPSPRSSPEVCDQFAEYAAEYKANLVRTDVTALPDALTILLPTEGWTVIPDDVPPAWYGNAPVRVDNSMSIVDLDQASAVLTGCAVAVAETGTVVLDAGFAQGRRAISLVPDHHICVVFEHQVVDTVAEAVARLDGTRPLTWISGPSATSDIELSRVEGVHGPRRLDIILVKT